MSDEIVVILVALIALNQINARGREKISTVLRLILSLWVLKL